jgi:hypothetical protein
MPQRPRKRGLSRKRRRTSQRVAPMDRRMPISTRRRATDAEIVL